MNKKWLVCICLVLTLLLTACAPQDGGVRQRQGSSVTNSASDVSALLAQAEREAEAQPEPEPPQPEEPEAPQPAEPEKAQPDESAPQEESDIDELLREKERPERDRSGMQTVLDDGTVIDIDLTKLSPTLVYAEVSGMVYEPYDYLGKVIRMSGLCASAHDEETGVTYYAIIIPDATACCAQGIEYLLLDGYDYPEDGGKAAVTGIFTLYEENGLYYCRLDEAAIEEAR